MKFRRLLAALAILLAGCGPAAPKRPRLCLFVGFDVSGSFMKSPYYDDAVEFLARYIHAHMAGLGDLEVPDYLFVGPVGGHAKDEAKTLYPKQTFEGKSPEDLAVELRKMFPKQERDDYTDFNSFFRQVSDTVKEKNLVLRPIAILLVSDGVPATGNVAKKSEMRKVSLNPLENLSRNVTVRLVYTDAVTGKEWRDEVPRRRVKVWTQDAAVMVTWKDPSVWQNGKPIAEQAKFLEWVKDNVDFGVRSKRVN
jgi:hypothetical protein